jgi:hypothetical protein
MCSDDPQEEGHILIFLTGAAEIDKACASLQRLLATRDDDKLVAFGNAQMEAVPLYGLLPPEDQARAFGAFLVGGPRKCVVATNIAGKAPSPLSARRPTSHRHLLLHGLFRNFGDGARRPVRDRPRPGEANCVRP